jgi:hypothetical protein
MSGDRPPCCERDWDRRSASTARPALLITDKGWPGERGPRTLSESSRVVPLKSAVQLNNAIALLINARLASREASRRLDRARSEGWAGV